MNFCAFFIYKVACSSLSKNGKFWVFLNLDLSHDFTDPLGNQFNRQLIYLCNQILRLTSLECIWLPFRLYIFGIYGLERNSGHGLLLQEKKNTTEIESREKWKKAIPTTRSNGFITDKVEKNKELKWKMDERTKIE